MPQGMNRLTKSRSVKVGSIMMGGNAPVSIQSMWDKPITQVDDALVSSLENLQKKGCDLMRFALPDRGAVDILKPLLTRLAMPIAGDIHFDYRIAVKAIEAGFPKIRINPGNIGAAWKVEEVIKAARDYGTAIRIGANEGSLGGKGEWTVQARSLRLVEGAEGNLELFERYNFPDIVVSLKSSDIEVTDLANREFRKRYDYPLHLGITEAGPLIPAIVKSSVGLSRLLREGIGETIRISISDNPEYEILAAAELLSALGLRRGRIQVIGCPKCGRTSFDTHGFLNSVKEELNTLPADLTIAVMGCSVNGPGEASHADLGITGSGNQVLIFKEGVVVRKEKLALAKQAFLEELETLRQQSISSGSR